MHSQNLASDTTQSRVQAKSVLAPTYRYQENHLKLERQNLIGCMTPGCQERRTVDHLEKIAGTKEELVTGNGDSYEENTGTFHQLCDPRDCSLPGTF